MQVTTFKVRTVRSRHGSNDPSSAATTWAEGEENRLDEASGDSGRLLMRAMSVAQPGACTCPHVPAQRLAEQPLRELLFVINRARLKCQG